MNKFYELFSIAYPEILPYYNTSYTFLEYLFFTLILLFNIRDKKYKIGAFISLLIFVGFQITFLFVTLSSKTLSLDAIPIGVETLLIYASIFYFFYNKFQNVKDEYIYYDHSFWIVIGLMIYLGGSFFFYILANHVERAELNKYWFVTYIIETIKNLLFAFAIFIQSLKRSKQKNSNKNIPYLDFN